MALHSVLAAAYPLVGLCGETGLRTWWTTWTLMSFVNALYLLCIYALSLRSSKNPAWAFPLPFVHLLLNLLAILVARSLGVLESKPDALVLVALILLDLAFVNRALVSILRPH